MLTLIGYKRCSTCTEVEKLLQKAGLDYCYREIDQQRPCAAELKAWKEKSGLGLSRFFNTSGQKYRELGLADKRTRMSEDEQLALLSTDGMLVKRPILLGAGDKGVLVGPDVKKYLQTL